MSKTMDQKVNELLAIVKVKKEELAATEKQMKEAGKQHVRISLLKVGRPSISKQHP